MARNSRKKRTASRSAGDSAAATEWLVLVHQYTRDPGSLRVKVWRRLQSLGAVAVKPSMYAMPNSEQAREDLAWLLKELVAGGAEGAIFEARFLAGMDDAQVRALFNQARSEDYKEIAGEARAALEALGKKRKPGAERVLQPARHQLARLQARLNEIEAIDFFGAGERGVAQGLVQTLADQVAGEARSDAEGETEVQTTAAKNLRGRVWVTRRGVRVDRIASAWLVRRWVDPKAVFKFTSDRRYKAGARELRFDMFEAEFTHEGDRCTFEVLMNRVGLDDPALRWIGELVHDIDLKDGKFGHPEAAGIASLLDGMAISVDDDGERIERGSLIFDGLYRSFREPSKRRPRRKKRRRP